VRGGGKQDAGAYSLLRDVCIPILTRTNVNLSAYSTFPLLSLHIRTQVCDTRFTRQALYTTLDTFRSPFGFTSRSEAYLINFNSGLDSLPTYPSPLDFWKHVRSQLLSLPRKSDRPITKVLLAGESVTDAKFLNILRDSLAEIAGPSARREASGDEGWRVNMTFAVDPDIDMLADPVFAAARGAALYARWRQEAPYDCVEHERCEAERRREMEKGPDELR
jgi:hypothetical protein